MLGQVFGEHCSVSVVEGAGISSGFSCVPDVPLSVPDVTFPFSSLYAGFVLSRFTVRPDGRTPCQYLLGTPCVSPLCMCLVNRYSRWSPTMKCEQPSWRTDGSVVAIAAQFLLTFLINKNLFFEPSRGFSLPLGGFFSFVDIFSFLVFF